jgi:hydrogenase small subunit
MIPSLLTRLQGETLGENLERRGVSRRDFLKFCGQLGVMLGVGASAAPRILHALDQQRRPSVIWLELQECTGCVESVIRAADPTIGNLILETLSLDYNHLLMAAAGHQAEEVLKNAIQENYGEYLLVVTGSVPMAEGGVYTTMGGRTALTVLEEAAAGCTAILAVGACAHYGSVQSAHPNPTEARGVDEIIKDKPIVNIAGCPPIAETVTATIVHVLTFGRLPEVDGHKRPKFAYGTLIHEQCPRRASYDAGRFVESFDDEGARQGFCLYHVGCKGPATYSPCPIFQWNMGTDWPIGAGHGCIGCTEPYFWDTMTPFYERLPDVPALGGVGRWADTVGAAAAAGAAAGVLAHGAVSVARKLREKGDEPGSRGDGGADEG